MKRLVIFLSLLAVLAACDSNKDEQPSQPSQLEQEMAALYGENKVIDGDYPDSLAVEVANGIFVGQREGALLTFKGIPYALQPTGERRWQVAKPEPDSRLVREAKYFGHSPIQDRRPSNAASLYPQGEDCLTLNVWTAADAMRSARRPVMVWIHGGSYVCDGTANPNNWGKAFVEAHPEVVFVSVGYRLGLLGFLDLSSLPDGKAYARSGNLGILDQVEALRWVKRNIRAFGGDPDNVTVMGHSAGAGSVALLASIDEAQGLFRRAIMQSGSVAFTSSREDCQRLTKLVLDATGAKTVADLQALSPAKIIALNEEVGEFYRFPERDGDVIPEDPYSRFDGFNAGIDMLIGSNADETHFWIDAMGGEEHFEMAVQLWYRYMGLSLSDEQRKCASSFIESVPDSKPWPVAELLNDLMFRGPAIEMAQRHAQAGGRTYMYYWTHPLKDPVYGACHGAEVSYVLNTGRQIKSGDVHNPYLADQVQQMWVNFALTGNPSTPDHYWPAYETASRATMVLGDTISLANDPLSGQRALIAPLMSEYVSPIFSDLLDKAPWYAGIALLAFIAILLLLTWIVIKTHRRIKKKSIKSGKTLVSLLLLFTCLAAAAQTGTYVPSEENLRARQEFQDNKLGVFIHWGVYSMLADGEWVMLNKRIDRDEYAQLPAGFYPSRFNADEWVSAIKDAGARYITITSRHHDGFSMFKSNASDYNIVDATPFKRDVLKELADACQRYGIKLHFYYSHLDWHRLDYPLGRHQEQMPHDPATTNWPQYYKFMNDQLTELLTNYGPIGAIWFDGKWEHDTDPVPFDWQLDEQYALIHRLQPSCLIGNNHHEVPFPGEDIQIFEQDIPGENTAGYSGENGISQLPLETCMTMNNTWGYRITDKNYKSSDDIIRTMVKAAGRNGNLLINVGPRPDGCLPDEAVERLHALGEWMRTNGESIYGTRGGIIPPHDWGVTTQRGNTLYVHILDLQDDALYLPLSGKSVKQVRLFSDKSKLRYTATGNGITIQLPAVPTGVDTIIELLLK